MIPVHEAATDHAKIDAVLTLTLKDCERAAILFQSLKLFEPLGVCWIVAPDEQVPEIRARVPSGNYEVLPDSVVIPELEAYRIGYRLHPRRSRRRVAGSQVHQLIKLAMAAIVRTPFYLTLDSDVICLRTVRHSDLIKNGRAIHKRFERDIHADWYRWAERVLGLRRSGFTHGVTPAILNRDAVMKLHEYLEGRVNTLLRAVSRALPLPSPLAQLASSWRSYLIRKRPWTEYCLYATFLEAMNLYEAYHVPCDEYAIYSHCVWTTKDFEDWDPRKTLNEDNSYFSIVQSTAAIPPRLVAEKVASFIA